MAQRTTFMTLPPELRDRAYGYIALSHTTRQVQVFHNEDTGIPEYKIASSPITATNRLIHNEFEDVARKSTLALEFTVIDWDFSHIINYFRNKMEPKYLTTLQMNKATIQVNISIRNPSSYKVDPRHFYTWALFLISIQLGATYHGNYTTWKGVVGSWNPTLADQCVIGENDAQVRDNIEAIRKITKAFHSTMWSAIQSGVAGPRIPMSS